MLAKMTDTDLLVAYRSATQQGDNWSDFGGEQHADYVDALLVEIDRRKIKL